MGHTFRSETQQLAVDSLRRYLAAEAEPFFNHEYRDRFVPKEKLLPFMRRLSEFGLVSGAISEANGGLGLDWPTIIMLLEEVAATSMDLSVPAIINMTGGLLLERLGPPHLIERYLPALVKGDSFISVAITEPDVGSNVLEIKTRARRDGDHWVINGEKCWISNGAYSDFLICTCRTGDNPADLTYFLLDRNEHPYEVREIDKLAFKSQSTAQIFLSDVRVPAENMIGTLGGALKTTLTLLEAGRVCVATQGVGVARRALEEAVRYTGQRRQHGKVIGAHQLVSAMLADMAVDVDAARLLVLRAAEMMQAGINAQMEAAMAKYFAAEAGVRVARQAVQLHGANGISTEFLVEKLARDALLVPIYEGTSQIQQLIIGRALTGIRAF
jgi:acyl-CoA dehydrogenase